MYPLRPKRETKREDRSRWTKIDGDAHRPVFFFERFLEGGEFGGGGGKNFEIEYC